MRIISTILTFSIIALLPFNVRSQDSTVPTPEPATKLSIKLENAEIKNIISEIADIYAFNVIIPEELTGNITLRLKNVSWQQVYEVMLESIGYYFYAQGNIIWIKSKEDIDLEPPDTKIFLLNNARAEELINIVSPLLDISRGDHITAYEQLNALVITASPLKLNKIEKLLY